MKVKIKNFVYVPKLAQKKDSSGKLVSTVKITRLTKSKVYRV